MQPHANMGIRQRRTRNKGFWWQKRAAVKAHKEAITEAAKEAEKDAGLFAKIANVWKGNKESEEISGK